MESALLDRKESPFFDLPQSYKSVSLSFIVCGSVDNGKSTLLGRLLYECGAVFQDQLTSIKEAAGQAEIDYSYILDGLEDERQQNITIDVAYRYFKTRNRSFIFLDTPGHDQYVRNMAVAASKANIAILVIDAVEKLTKSTIRHICILSLMRIKKFIICINKIDLINYDKAIYEEILENVKNIFVRLSEVDLIFIPVSAINGDNITSCSANTPWYQGKDLLVTIEEIEPFQVNEQAFYMPVQCVLKNLSQKFRGYAGLPGAGTVSVEESVKILPSGQSCTIEKIYEGEKEVTSSSQNSVLLKMKEDLDITRGDLIVSKSNLINHSSQFLVRLLWLDNEKPLLKSRKYLFKHIHILTLGIITKIKGVFDLENPQITPKEEIENNDIGLCNVCLEKDIYFLPYDQDHNLGSFILIDQTTLETIGIAVIEHALDKSNNLQIEKSGIDKTDRSLLKKQKPFLVWFTGLSGSGKSTLANMLEKKLYELGYHTYVIHGDNIRRGLNIDLGFKVVDRIENIRRIGEVAKMFLDAGLIVIVAAISPFETERNDLKKGIGPGEFVEVFVDAALETCMRRDSKGLYVKQREGKARNFTGIDSPYEIPKNPDVHLDSNNEPPTKLLNQLMLFFYKNNFLSK